MMVAAFSFYESFPTRTITSPGRGEWTGRERDESLGIGSCYFSRRFSIHTAASLLTRRARLPYYSTIYLLIYLTRIYEEDEEGMGRLICVVTI